MAKAKSTAVKASAKKLVAKKAAVKKSVNKKATPKSTRSGAIKKAAPSPWSAIHIFGHGESHVMGKEINGKAQNNELKTITPLLEYLATKQQKGTKINPNTLRTLNIFNEMFVDFHPKGIGNKLQRFAWDEVDNKKINKLADELKATIKANSKENTKTKRPAEKIKALLAKRRALGVKEK